MCELIHHELFLCYFNISGIEGVVLGLNVVRCGFEQVPQILELFVISFKFFYKRHFYRTSLRKSGLHGAQINKVVFRLFSGASDPPSNVSERQATKRWDHCNFVICTEK